GGGARAPPRRVVLPVFFPGMATESVPPGLTRGAMFVPTSVSASPAETAWLDVSTSTPTQPATSSHATAWIVRFRAVMVPPQPDERAGVRGLNAQGRVSAGEGAHQDARQACGEIEHEAGDEAELGREALRRTCRGRGDRIPFS